MDERPANANVLDPEVVDQLRALARAGDSELLHKLQAAFARDTPERLRALRAAVVEGDADAAAFAVHALKGSAAGLGAREVVATCQQLERSPASDAARIEPLLAELALRTGRAQAELTRIAEAG